MLSLIVLLMSTLSLCLGFDVSDVERLNNEIIEIMETGRSVNDSSQLLKDIALFSGGLIELTMNIVKGVNVEETLKVCEDIYKYGKPDFLDHKTDLTRKRKVFEWSDEDEAFFSNILLDARSAWAEFIENYNKIKQKFSSTEK